MDTLADCETERLTDCESDTDSEMLTEVALVVGYTLLHTEPLGVATAVHPAPQGGREVAVQIFGVHLASPLGVGVHAISGHTPAMGLLM